MLSNLLSTWIYTCSLAYMMNTTGCPISDLQQGVLLNTARCTQITVNTKFVQMHELKSQTTVCLYLSSEE